MIFNRSGKFGPGWVDNSGAADPVGKPCKGGRLGRRIPTALRWAGRVSVTERQPLGWQSGVTKELGVREVGVSALETVPGSNPDASTV